MPEPININTITTGGEGLQKLPQDQGKESVEKKPDLMVQGDIHIVPTVEASNYHKFHESSCLMSNFLNRMEKAESRFSFGEHIKKTLKKTPTAAALVTALALLTAPMVIELKALGYSPTEAVVYLIGSLPKAGNYKSMEKTEVKKISDDISNRSLSHEGAEIIEETIKEVALEERHLVIDLLTEFLIGLGFYEAWCRRFGSKEKRENIEKGTEKIKRKGEQIFVLGGKSSNVTDALSLAGKDHVIPIFEEAGGGRYITHKLHGVKNEKSTFLNLNIDESSGISYRKSPAWEQLVLDKSNLIHTSDGKEYLMVVGCGEVAEEELADASGATDLTQDNFYSGIDMIRKRVKDKHIKDDDIVKVYLGSGQLPRIDDRTGEMTTTDRDVAKKGGIDVYIDTWSIMLKEIKSELQHGNFNQSGISLVTTVNQYRDLISKVAKEINVPYHMLEENDSSNSLILVYERTTEETFNSVKRYKRQYPNRKVVALTSNIETDKDAHEEGIETICSAAIISEVVERVRSEVKKGTPIHKLQHIVDSSIV